MPINARIRIARTNTCYTTWLRKSFYGFSQYEKNFCNENYGSFVVSIKADTSK
jgi:hypothetical protein